MVDTGSTLTYAAIVFFVILIVSKFFQTTSSFTNYDPKSRQYYHGPVCVSWPTYSSTYGTV